MANFLLILNRKIDFRTFTKNSRKNFLVIDKNMASKNPEMMQIQSNQCCRLCISPDKSLQRSLYDEKGHANEIHQLMTKYFTSTMLNMEWEKYLTYICEDCWHTLNDFNIFQESIIKAQEGQLKDLEKISESGGQVPQEDSGRQLRKRKGIAAEINIPEIRKQLKAALAQKIKENSGDGKSKEAIVTVKSEKSVTVKSEKSVTVKSEKSDEQPETYHEFDNSHNEEEMSLQSYGSWNYPQNTELITCDRNYEDYSSDDEKPLASMFYESYIIDEEIEDPNDESLPTNSQETPKKLTVEEFDVLVSQWKSSLDCEICHMTFPRYSSFIEHFKEQHSRTERYIMCCGKKLRNRYEVGQHISYHNAPDELRCDICCKCYRLEKFLLKHKAFVHCTEKSQPKTSTNVDKEGEGGDNHKCDKCEKSFKNRTSLLTHCRLVHGPKARECPYCDKSFASGTVLRQHLDIHKGEKIHKCPFCSEGFTCKPYLRKHVRRYHPVELKKKEEEIPNQKSYVRIQMGDTTVFQCKFCPKQYERKYSLHAHVHRLHRGEKPPDNVGLKIVQVKANVSVPDLPSFSETMQSFGTETSMDFQEAMEITENPEAPSSPSKKGDDEGLKKADKVIVKTEINIPEIEHELETSLKSFGDNKKEQKLQACLTETNLTSFGDQRKDLEKEDKILDIAIKPPSITIKSETPLEIYQNSEELITKYDDDDDDEISESSKMDQNISMDDEMSSQSYGLRKTNSRKSYEEYSSDDDMPLSAMLTENDSRNKEALDSNDESHPSPVDLPKTLTMEEFDTAVAQWKSDLLCEICPEIISSYSLLEEHFTKEHSPDEGLSIKCCGQNLQNRLEVGQHISYHNAPAHLRCDNCCKAYDLEISLRKHNCSSSATNESKEPKRRGNHVCDLCLHHFKTERSFLTHQRLVHGIKTTECNICHKVFCNMQVLRQHLAMHKGERTHKCPNCPKAFTCKAYWRRHLRKCRKQTWDPSEEVILSRHRTYICVRVDKKIVFKCKFCKFFYESRHSLRTHTRKYHRDHMETPKPKVTKESVGSDDDAAEGPEMDIPEDMLYKCCYCSKRFELRCTLYSHISRSHHTLLPKISEFASTIKVPLRVDGPTTTYQEMHRCKVCRREYKDKTPLFIHIKRIHADKFQPQCEGPKFPISFTISAAQFIETTLDTSGNKIFKCKLCFKEYTRRYSLYTHIQRNHKNNLKANRSSMLANKNSIDPNPQEKDDIADAAKANESSDSLMVSKDGVLPVKDKEPPIVNTDIVFDSEMLENIDDMAAIGNDFDNCVAQWKPDLQCEICFTTLPMYSLLAQHFKLKHPTVACYILCCQFKLYHQTEIEEHIEYHNALTKLKGKRENELENPETELQATKIKQEIPDASKSYDDDNDGIYQSQDFTPDKSKSSNTTSASSSPNSQHVCFECNKSFKSHASLKLHIHISHKDKKPLILVTSPMPVHSVMSGHVNSSSSNRFSFNFYAGCSNIDRSYSEMLHHKLICCRLCTNICNDHRSLIDEAGQPNETHQLMTKYFTNAMLNMEWGKRFTHICEECWNHLNDFHNFQESIILAQKINESRIQMLDKTLREREITEQDDDDNFSALDGQSEVRTIKVEKDDNTQQETTHLEMGEIGNIKVEKDDSNHLEMGRVEDIKVEVEEDNIPVETNMQTQKTTVSQTLPATKNIDNAIPTDVRIKKEVPDDLDHNDSSEKLQTTSDSIELYDEEYSDDDEINNESDDIGGYMDTDEEILETSKRNSMDSNEEFVSDGDLSLSHEEDKQKYLQEFDKRVALWKSSLDCEVCHEKLPSYSLLMQHFSQYHSSIVCKIVCCQRELQTRHDIDTHIRYHNAPADLRCDICRKSYLRKNCLKVHVAKIHSEKVKDSVVQQPYPCDKCDRSFSTSLALYQHSQTIHGLKKYSCFICDKTFARPCILKEHLALHRREKIEHCPLCDEAFVCKTYRNRHIRCEHKREWEEKRNLRQLTKKPMRFTVIDQGEEKIFKCLECSKECRRKPAMDVHIRRKHSGIIQNFPCPYCPKEYSEKAVLNAHIKKNHKDQIQTNNKTPLVLEGPKEITSSLYKNWQVQEGPEPNKDENSTLRKSWHTQADADPNQVENSTLHKSWQAQADANTNRDENVILQCTTNETKPTIPSRCLAQELVSNQDGSLAREPIIDDPKKPASWESPKPPKTESSIPQTQANDHKETTTSGQYGHWTSPEVLAPIIPGSSMSQAIAETPKGIPPTSTYTWHTQDVPYAPGSGSSMVSYDPNYNWQPLGNVTNSTSTTTGEIYSTFNWPSQGDTASSPSSIAKPKTTRSKTSTRYTIVGQGDEMVYKCLECSKECSKKPAMEVHIRRKHSGIIQIFKCSYCPKEYNEKSVLNMHIKRIHKDVSRNQVEATTSSNSAPATMSGFTDISTQQQSNPYSWQPKDEATSSNSAANSYYWPSLGQTESANTPPFNGPSDISSSHANYTWHHQSDVAPSFAGPSVSASTDLNPHQNYCFSSQGVHSEMYNSASNILPASNYSWQQQSVSQSMPAYSWNSGNTIIKEEPCVKQEPEDLS
ncbi:uncharacterized protein LOC142230779 [Haematobia irritans]|uniref:uncharacterized protein LOC142230779 n=1 Tax=Haematobia irritans TaxID=7368 RepID=UPI003F50A5ED